MSEQCHVESRVTHPASVLLLGDDIARRTVFALRDDVVRTEGLLAGLLFHLVFHHCRIHVLNARTMHLGQTNEDRSNRTRTIDPLVQTALA
jgi:hypothetical protein